MEKLVKWKNSVKQKNWLNRLKMEKSVKQKNQKNG